MPTTWIYRAKKVLLKFPVGILGDVLAWFPYAEVFRQKHQYELYCVMAEDMIEIIKPGYPEISFIKAEERPEGLYASYYMGIFFPCDDRVHQPVDWRLIGLHQNAAMILGVDPGEQRIRLLPKNKKRKIKEPYVCIAAQASSQAKYWNNGNGWLNVVKHLKERGYRVLCIDRENVYAQKSRYNIIPYGTEDFTGKLPLQERVDILYHADFFCRPFQRPQLGSQRHRHTGSADQWLYAAGQRILHALPGNQLPRLQRLLERYPHHL